ncbi:hypothetical protein C2W62_38745 [Candidatus Entotheonella serta]|nr:hypothetical protein C2W62_38745 [Candidatus Entotheonella serta]
MLYIVECGFADPDQESAWNEWYSGPKLSVLLAVPGFLSAQRFRALDGDKSPYLNLTSIESAEMFTNPSYHSQGGGRFGPWDLALIIDWRRLLFTGIEEMPLVPENHCLVRLDCAPEQAPELGIALSWVKGVDWTTASNYGDGAALDSSVPHRGLSIIDMEMAKTLPPVPGLRVYEPICPKRVT